MSDKINTRDHNLEVLQYLGYRKVRNTTIFESENDFILSPAVSESTNGKYWFDVREVNLNQINSNSLLLVRIVPDLFILETIKSISSLLSKQVMDNRPNSGNVWGIHIDLNKPSNSALLYNIKNTDNKIPTKLLKKTAINEAVSEIKKKVPRKTSFASFSRYPAGLVYWGKGYKSMAYVTADDVPSPKPPSR